MRFNRHGSATNLRVASSFRPMSLARPAIRHPEAARPARQPRELQATIATIGDIGVFGALRPTVMA
jgi:hypothetical protein